MYLGICSTFFSTRVYKITSLTHFYYRKLCAMVSYSVIDEPQFLAFWQVNKQTTDVPKKNQRKISFLF